MTPFSTSIQMITMVAIALGQDLLNEVAFVGGCTTSLLISDEYSKEDARYTDDVDLIIDIVGRINWFRFQEMLTRKGFTYSHEDTVMCRMRLSEMKVDFMPHDESILGFTNRWYEKALETATPYTLNNGLIIRVLTPPLFVATKLEAYLGRGNNDPIGSKDIEDIISIFDGRPEIVKEIAETDQDIVDYISHQIGLLLENAQFEYAVQGATKSNNDREKLIFSRLDEIKALSKQSET